MDFSSEVRLSCGLIYSSRAKSYEFLMGKERLAEALFDSIILKMLNKWWGKGDS